MFAPIAAGFVLVDTEGWCGHRGGLDQDRWRAAGRDPGGGESRWPAREGAALAAI